MDSPICYDVNLYNSPFFFFEISLSPGHLDNLAPALAHVIHSMHLRHRVRFRHEAAVWNAHAQFCLRWSVLEQKWRRSGCVCGGPPAELYSTQNLQFSSLE